MGYIGGSSQNPTYREVCGQRNDEGHTEAIRVEFDPHVISYEQLMRRFFDEATPNIVRLQYRSAVWAQDATQAETAERVAREAGKAGGVAVLGSAAWHDAEPYHQKYYEKQCSGPHVCRRL